MLAVALSAMACSDDPPPAAPEVFTPATGTDTDLTDPSTTLIPPAPEDPPEIEGPTLADFDVPCGRDAAPSPSSEVGVDDDVVVVGTGNDRGARFAGSFGAGMPEAVAAMADHCTALGGVAGRGLLVESYDAAVVEVADRAREQCTEVLAVVGAGYATPIAGLEPWAECGMPIFEPRPSWLVTPDPIPIEAHRFAWFAEPAAGAVAVVVPDTLEGEAMALTIASALTADGFAVVADLRFSLGAEPDWIEIADEVTASGAGLIHVEGSCADTVVPLLSAFGAADTVPLVTAGPSTYDQGCIASAAAAGAPVDRLLIQIPFLPLEDGDDAPVTQAFAEILASYAADVSGDALLASAAFWSFADAVDACGAELTRGCLQERLDGEGAGLTRRADATCRVVLGVDAGAFVRILPDEPGRLACAG